jgi:lipopolysaccharide/colanic/teichoic acid biosynthesis glycosyltransferase
MFVKRVFDLCFAVIGIVLFFPLFILISLLIIIDSKGPVFYIQRRVGRNRVDFKLFKFRTMFVNSDRFGYLTVGSRDMRITQVGYWLRKFKLDELPQLINVLLGDMSFVGPRPEVRKYVNLYTSRQLRVLSIKPGITDWASIYFFNENELLANAEEPEKLYITQIIPSKIFHNLNYIDERDFWVDIKIIFQTIQRIVKR